MTQICVILLILIMVTAPLAAQQPDNNAAYFTGEYPNLLAEWGVDQADIDARIEAVWQQLFYGSDSTQRVYYPVGDDMAYMLDVANNDVRSEGISYGMMIAVQLDKQEEFDRLWTWAKTHMYQAEEPYQGYFAWHTDRDGNQLNANPASDGEEWFVTALFFASARWGDGEGIYNYAAEANTILNDMLRERPPGAVTPMFDASTQMIVFVPTVGRESSFTDPSYHLPQFYELWARWAENNNDYWAEAAAISRDFWQTTAHPETGLMPNYAEFTGEPKPYSNYGEYFYADSWRNGMTVAMDYVWFAPSEWHVEQSDRLLAFFHDLGIGRYNSRFLVDGTPADPQHRATGLVAMNAVASLAASDAIRWDFVEEFWNTPIPAGQYRYYDGLLYMLALLNLSGNFRIYEPS
jgi:oligosaccharide reducing-end xylanase